MTLKGRAAERIDNAIARLPGLAWFSGLVAAGVSQRERLTETFI